MSGLTRSHIACVVSSTGSAVHFTPSQIWSTNTISSCRINPSILRLFVQI